MTLTNLTSYNGQADRPTKSQGVFYLPLRGQSPSIRSERTKKIHTKTIKLKTLNNNKKLAKINIFVSKIMSILFPLQKYRSTYAHA